MQLYSNAHLLSATFKDSPLSIRLSRDCDFFIKISNYPKRKFYEESRRLGERSLNIHMSQVKVDK